MADGSGLTAVFSGNQSSAYSGQPSAGVVEFFSEFPTQDTRPLSTSIRLGEHHAARRRLAGDHAHARFLLAVERDATDRRLGVRRDPVFRFPRAVPVSEEETPRL